MSDILRFRERRFRTLHDLLTGSTPPKTPESPGLSHHLSRDVGLPERPAETYVIGPMGQLIAM